MACKTTDVVAYYNLTAKPKKKPETKQKNQNKTKNKTHNTHPTHVYISQTEQKYVK